MFVQDGFLYLIVTKHKLTVQTSNHGASGGGGGVAQKLIWDQTPYLRAGCSGGDVSEQLMWGRHLTLELELVVEVSLNSFFGIRHLT